MVERALGYVESRINPRPSTSQAMTEVQLQNT